MQGKYYVSHLVSRRLFCFFFITESQSCFIYLFIFILEQQSQSSVEETPYHTQLCDILSYFTLFYASQKFLYLKKGSSQTPQSWSKWFKAQGNQISFRSITVIQMIENLHRKTVWILSSYCLLTWWLKGCVRRLSHQYTVIKQRGFSFTA